MITVALVRSPAGRLDPVTVGVADGAMQAYGCGSRLADPGMSCVAWVTGDADAEGLAADLRSVFGGSGATVDVTTSGAETIAAVPPPGSLA